MLLMLNDDSGAFFEVAGMIPGTPQSGPAFERFYNEWHFPEQVWRVLVVIIAIAAGWCAYGMLKVRRMRANTSLERNRGG
jgi:hypothetical protein